MGGGSGHGFKHGPVIGAHVVGRLDGAPPVPDDRFSLQRPGAGSGTLPHRRGRARGGVGGQRRMSQMQDWMQWQPTTREAPARVPRPDPGARRGGHRRPRRRSIAGLMPWAEGTVPGRGRVRAHHLLGPRRRRRRRRRSSCSQEASRSSSCTARRPRRGCDSCTRSRTCCSLLAAASLLTGYRAATQAIVAWENRGGQGSIALGLYLAAIGVVVMGVGLAALLPAIRPLAAGERRPGRSHGGVEAQAWRRSIAGLAGDLRRRGARDPARRVDDAGAAHRADRARGGVRRAARRLRGLVGRARDRRRGVATPVAPG